MSQGKKQLLEFAPLLVFLLYTFLSTGKVAKVPLATAILVAVFGGLTLYLHDEVFIKVKVTLINAIFAVLLLGGVRFGRYFIKDVMGEALSLPDDAWRTLSIRWGVFFAFLALANEAVWRNFTTDQWVTFKVFGLMGVTLVFALANAPFMARYMADDVQPSQEKPSVDG
jgi:intracellular septation protein